MNNSSFWFKNVPDEQKFPPLSRDLSTEVLIIGGGIVGLMSAWYALQQGRRVKLVEKNHVGSGDTSTTTGFLTKVADTPLADLTQKYGEKFVQKLFEQATQSQSELFQLIEDQHLDCDFQKCSSFNVAYEKNDQNFEEEWEAAKAAYPAASRSAGPLKIFAEAIRYPNEGSFHVRKFLFALLRLCQSRGLEVFEETEIVALQKMSLQKSTATAENKEIILARTRNFLITADQVIVAAGDPSTLFPELKNLLKPKISYVIVAESADEMNLSENLYWDMLQPYFYFRALEPKKIMVGGCDVTIDHIGQQKPFEQLETFLHEKFPGSARVTHQWSGTLYETIDGLPYAFEHPHFEGKIFVACGFSGNGLVFGTMAAKTLIELMMGEKNETTRMLSLSRTNTQLEPSQIKKTNPAKTFSNIKNCSPNTTPNSDFIKIAELSDFAKRNVLAKTVNGTTIALYKIKDQIFALNNRCTHAGGSLAEGTFENGVAECPLHGGQFDVKTGQNLRPPPIRPVQTYPVRIIGKDVEVKLELEMTPNHVGLSASTSVLASPSTIATPAKINSASKNLARENHWSELLKFSGGAVLFWLIEWSLQYFWLVPGDLGLSLLRSFALTGATLIGLALFSSAIFKWYPKLAVHWRWRRHLGVGGFVFIVFHVAMVFAFRYRFNLGKIYYSFNPLENPIIFGSIAFPIFMIMASTSTDWAMNKLTPKVWKFIHRFVYIAYLSAIFHFLLVNPPLLQNPAGYLLLVVTGFAVFGQLFWFFKIAGKKRFLTLGGLVGWSLILLAIILSYFAWLKFS